MSKLATCSCPVCNEEVRIDKLVGHCLRRHREELYNSMPIATRKTICKLQIPILFGYHNNEKVVNVCLSCGKGNNCRSRKNGSIGGRVSDVCASHEACRSDWKEFEYIYSDLESAPVPLPFPIKRNDNPKKAAVKREVVAEGTTVVAGMTDGQKALLKQVMDILDPPMEGWDDDEGEEKSVKDQLSNLLRIVKKNQTSEDKYKAAIAKEQKRVAALEEENEMLKEAAPAAAPASVPANVADLRELLRESNESKEELKEQVESLRKQLSAANMNTLPSIEITDNTEELRAENEELKGEIEGFVARGCVEPSLISPLMTAYHDNISEPVEDPTINDMVRGILAKLI